jgi:hypothetical protein
MKTFEFTPVILISTLLVLSACTQKSEVAGRSGSMSKMETDTYACPMHPEVTDTKPSKCSKCGMTLVKKT